MGTQKNTKEFDITNDKGENVGIVIVRSFRVEESLCNLYFYLDQLTMKWKGG